MTIVNLAPVTAPVHLKLNHFLTAELNGFDLVLKDDRGQLLRLSEMEWYNLKRWVDYNLAKASAAQPDLTSEQWNPPEVTMPAPPILVLMRRYTTKVSPWRRDTTARGSMFTTVDARTQHGGYTISLFAMSAKGLDDALAVVNESDLLREAHLVQLTIPFTDVEQFRIWALQQIELKATKRIK